MKKPRIAVISSYFPTGGEPYRGHSAYQTLRPLQAHTDLCAFVALPAYPRWCQARPKDFRYRRMDLSYRPPDMDARYYEYAALPLVNRPINGELCYRCVRQDVRTFQPDLILNYWLYPDGYAAVRCARRLGVPVILCALGSDLRRIADPFTRAWTRYALRRADHVISVSSELTRQAIALGANPAAATTILNGYDERTFHPRCRAGARAALGLETAARVILYVGSLIPSKGLIELWEAFGGLAAGDPQLTLVLGGEGPLREELSRRATATGLAGRLMLPGALSSETVSQWMAAADLFTLPSHSEGCPNVVIEALACGRPVVGTDVGGIPELVTPDNGRLVPVGDVAALAAAIDETLQRRWDPGAVAATYARSWEAVAADTWEVCRRYLPAQVSGRRHSGSTEPETAA